jgi:hypothetical protein
MMAIIRVAGAPPAVKQVANWNVRNIPLGA